MTITRPVKHGRYLAVITKEGSDMPQTTPSREDTDFVLAGTQVMLPGVAAGSAVKRAAKRFESAYDLPPGAAFALAAASVDPSAERSKIPSQNPSEQLHLIRTPSDEFLACHAARLWSPLVAGDGSNGRSRFELQTAVGSPARPWPIAQHLDPAIVAYEADSIEEMALAAEASADKIRSPRLLAEISRHERGVWNPPVVVLAKTEVGGEEFWFLHTIDGSTRIEACHELTEVEAGAPLRRSDAPLDHLREAHGEFVDWFGTLPGSPDTLAAARATTIPAWVVVGLVDEEGQPITDRFPDVVNSYVESVHVQPRPFSRPAMNNVLGERLLLTLRREGHLDGRAAEKLLGRSKGRRGKPSVRAAELVHLVCQEDNEEFVREVAVTDGKKLLTQDRRAELIGPLVLRQFEERAESAESALMRRFAPVALIEEEWAVNGIGAKALRRRAIGAFEKGDLQHSALLELVARGGTALCAAGLLLSDQGSTVEEKAELRGPVSKVLEGLLESRGGIEVLAEATAWADGDQTLLPRQRRPDGTVKTNAHGDELHYAVGYTRGNMKIRALALNDGVVPGKRRRKGGQGTTRPAMPPEEIFKMTEREMLVDIRAAHIKLRDLATMKDEEGRELIDRMGLTPNETVELFTRDVTKAYARYARENPLAELSEDGIPQLTTLEDEE